MPNFIVLYISFVFKGLRGLQTAVRLWAINWHLLCSARYGKRALIAVSLYFSIVLRISQ